MKKNILFRLLAALVVASMLLAACGGGGGGTETPPPPKNTGEAPTTFTPPNAVPVQTPPEEAIGGAEFKVSDETLTIYTINGGRAYTPDEVRLNLSDGRWAAVGYLLVEHPELLLVAAAVTTFYYVVVAQAELPAIELPATVFALPAPEPETGLSADQILSLEVSLTNSLKVYQPGVLVDGGDSSYNCGPGGEEFKVGFYSYTNFSPECPQDLEGLFKRLSEIKEWVKTQNLSSKVEHTLDIWLNIIARLIAL